LADWFKLTAESSGDTPVLNSLSCRLRIGKILEINKSKFRDVRDKVFCKLWNQAARGLFGDEAVTLRNIEDLLYVLRYSSNKEYDLGQKLLAKLPCIGELGCLLFATELLEIVEYCVSNDPRTLKPNDHPMHFLICLVIQEEIPDGNAKDSVLASYPEYVSHLKQANLAHPLIRLAAWATALHKHLKPDFNLDLNSLARLEVIDQVGFPFIIGVHSNSILQFNNCHSFTTDGDYRDITWMINQLQHGYCFDWKKVKKTWKKHYIVNAAQFDRLLSVCAVSSPLNSQVVISIEETDRSFNRILNRVYLR
jgi:hypothetical protein